MAFVCIVFKVLNQKSNSFLASVSADIIFAIEHSVNEVRAGEDGFPRPVDYVIAQKTQIKSIIQQLGVSTCGHRYILAHFSDDVVNNPWFDPLSNNRARNKTGILFGPQDGYSMDEMFRRIDAFPELTLGGATNLKL